MMKTQSDHTCAIFPFHLDNKLKEQADVKELLLLLLSETDAGTTAVLYSSPQLLVKHFPTIIQDLLDLGVLLFVCVDEINLFTHFGRSSHSEFNRLKTVLFAKLPKKIPSLFLTTFTHCIKDLIGSLIGLAITHIYWHPVHEMADRKISFFISYSSSYTVGGLKLVGGSNKGNMRCGAVSDFPPEAWSRVSKILQEFEIMK